MNFFFLGKEVLFLINFNSKSVVETNDALRASGSSIVEMTSRYNKTASDINVIHFINNR
jgi:hypothetical protein